MIYGYLRVSTDQQNLENQRYEITNYCAKNSLGIDDWISEAISGTKDPKKRKLGKLLRKLKKGDILICSEISRLGRTLFMIMDILNFCLNKEVQVWTVKEAYKLGDDISSKVLAFAFGLSAEIERKLISERTKEALKRKKDEGMTLGRPKGSKNKNPNPKINMNKVNHFRAQGLSVRKIAKKIKIHPNTLYRYIKNESKKH